MQYKMYKVEKRLKPSLAYKCVVVGRLIFSIGSPSLYSYFYNNFFFKKRIKINCRNFNLMMVKII